MRPTSWDEWLLRRPARVIRDELHLRSRATTTRTSILAIPPDPVTRLASPLTWERLDRNPAFHSEADDLDSSARTQLGGHSVIAACGGPWSTRCDHRRANRVLVEWNLYRVVPFGDAPYLTLEISTLTRKEAKEDL
jgi:hypothetical protein